MNVDAGNAIGSASLAALKRDAVGSPKDEATLRKVAQQFEALLTQQVLKASRANALGEDLMSGAGLDLYKDMFDQQMAQQISSGKGLGLADVLVQQLRGSKTLPAALPAPTPIALASPVATAISAIGASAGPLTDRISHFVKNIWQQAEAAAKTLGLPTEAVVGHAALETGWGQHQPAGNSNNLFGIKADKNWQGAKVKAETLEMDGGHSRNEHAAFRAYANPDEGFADYAHFLMSNPRYSEALRSGSSQQFAEGLQKAGYATDPHYADKLKSAIARVAAAKAAAAI